MASISASNLLIGTDEDFVINLYLAVLRRWPDPEGFAYFTARVAGDGEARRGVMLELAASPEAMQQTHRLEVPDPLLPGDPMSALQAQLALRSEYLHRLASAPPPPAPAAPLEAVAPLLREMRAELESLRREMRERVAEMAPAIPAPSPATPDLADWVHDMLAMSEARMELRMRALEKRRP